MSRLHAIELHLLMLAGIAFLSVSGWQVWQTGKTLDAANGAIQGVDSTIANLNRPCKGKAGPDACGTLAQINKTDIDIGEAVITMQRQVAQTGKLTAAAATTLQTTANRASGALTALTGTAKAATETLHGASLDLEAVNDSIQVTKPLIEASAKTVQDYGAIAPYLKQSMVNMQGITLHFNAIAGDAQQVSDKETKDFLKPVKWYMRPVKRFGEFWDITAAVARHTP